MNWIDFLTALLIVYILYYAIVILYDFFIKGKSSSSKKEEILITFEEEKPKKVPFRKSKKASEEETNKLINDAKLQQAEIKKETAGEEIKKESSAGEEFKFEQFTGVKESMPVENGKEYGVNLFDLKSIYNKIGSQIETKEKKVNFEQAIA